MRRNQRGMSAAGWGSSGMIERANADPWQRPVAWRTFAAFEADAA
jgi:hypothetical protein